MHNIKIVGLPKAQKGVTVSSKSTSCGDGQVYLEGTGCIDIASPMYRQLYESGQIAGKGPDGSIVSPTMKPFVVNSKLTDDQKNELRRREMQKAAFQNQTTIGPATQQPWYSRALDVATHPGTAIRAYNTMGYVPHNLNAVADYQGGPANVLNSLSPASWLKAGYKAGEQLVKHPIQTPIDLIQGAGNLTAYGINKMDSPLPGQTMPEFRSPFGDAGTNERALNFLGNVGEALPLLEFANLPGVSRFLKPKSKVSNSIMRNAEGQIQFLDDAAYRDALVTGKKNVINYLSDPRYASVVEQNQQMANRLGLNQTLPIQREMAQPSLYEARLAKINEPLSLNDPRSLEMDIINNNSSVVAQYVRSLNGKGSLTIPRVHSPSEITRNTSHEVLHHIYPNLGEGYPSFTPLEARKAKAVFKNNAALREIEQKNNVPLWYLDDVDELVPNSFDLANDLGIEKFQKYPGMESFKNMLNSYSGDKKFIRDALKLDSKRDYKRAWDMLSGVRLGVVPTLLLLQQQKNGGSIDWLDKYQYAGQFNIPGVTDFKMTPPASESTSHSFYNPMLGRAISTATTGQSKQAMAASTADMGKAKEAERIAEAKRVAERKAAKALQDGQTKTFTFPTGEVKSLGDMNFREREYVAGKSLENRGRINENEEAWYDEFNPVNWVTSMAGALATSPYEAKQSGSNMPYVSAILNPVLMGRMMGSGSVNPFGKKFWTNEVSNSEFLNSAGMGIPGMVKGATNKVGQSMESGVLSKLDQKLYPTRAYRAFIPGGNPELYSNLGTQEAQLAKKVFGKGEFATKDLSESFQYLRGTEGTTPGYSKQGLLTGQGMNLTEYKVPFWKKNVSFDKDVTALKRLQNVDVNSNEYLIPGKTRLDRILYPRRTNYIEAVPEHLKDIETLLPSGHTTKFYSKGTIPMSASSTMHVSEPYKYIEDQINAVTGHRMPITYEFDQSLGHNQNVPFYDWKQPQFPQFQGVGNFKEGGQPPVNPNGMYDGIRDWRIPGGNITMKGVPFPVLAKASNGMTRMMYPGQQYSFPGANHVDEYPLPMAQNGLISFLPQQDPEMTYRDRFNTPLNKRQTKRFNEWAAEESERQGRDIMMDKGAYDVQGFWKSGDYKKMDKDNHGNDMWKKPNHPTFSNQSRYHGVDGFYGGNWTPEAGYQPSKQTVSSYGPSYYNWMFGLEPNRPEHLDASRYMSGANAPSPLYYKNGGLTKYQIKGQVSQQDSVRHLAGQTMDYEFKKGSPTGGGLTDWGYHSSQLPYNKVPANWHAPQTKEEAVNMYMNEIASNPTLGYFTTAMEKGEAGDFLYNTGRDPRVYMLDQYLKSIGQVGLSNRGSYNVDTKTQQWTPALQSSLDQQWNQYSGEINKLPTNTRRQLLNKGRDFYYQNINKQPDGSPNPAYEATWKPRIWESVNTYHKYGGWLKKYQDGNQVTYTVKKGDTLSQIGKQFGMTPQQIADANNISNIDFIRTNQKLNIPVAAIPQQPAVGPTDVPIAPVQFQNTLPSFVQTQPTVQGNYIASPDTSINIKNNPEIYSELDPEISSIISNYTTPSTLDNEEDTKKRETARRIVEIARQHIAMGKKGYFEVPPDVAAASYREGKEPAGCVGGACKIAQEAGAMPKIFWSNTAFTKAAPELGFPNKGYGLRGIQNLEPGDFLTHQTELGGYDEKGNPKYIPRHTQIFLGINPQTKEYEFFDNHHKRLMSYSEDDIRDKLKQTKNSYDYGSVIYKNNPFHPTANSYTDETVQQAADKELFVKEQMKNPSKYKYSIRSDAKDYNNSTKGIMNTFVNYANDDKNITDLVSKLKVGKDEIHDSLLNVFGELGQENNWSNSGKGLKSKAENVAEKVLTFFGGAKRYSVGPGQNKFSTIPEDLREQFGIKSPKDLYDISKVIPLMVAEDIRNKQVLRRWGQQNVLSHKLIGHTDKENPLRADHLKGGVGRWSPYLRNEFGLISTGKRVINNNDLIPWNGEDVTWDNWYKPGAGKLVSNYDMDAGMFMNPRTLAEGSYPDKVFHKTDDNLQRTLITPNTETSPDTLSTQYVFSKAKKKKEFGGQNNWLNNYR